MNIDPNRIVSAALLAQRTGPKLEELKKATQSFEAVFLKKLFSTMREGVKHVKLGESQGEEMYNDMFDQALAEGATKSGSYGIGKMLYKSFAPKVVAMEQLRLRAESAVSAAIYHSVPETASDRPNTSGQPDDASIQHIPPSNATR